MKSVAICDSDSSLVIDLDEYLKSNINDVVIDVYCKGNSLLFSNKIYDAIFLDVDLPDIDGLSVAKTIRLKNDYTKIIFVSKNESLIAESIHYNPFRYVRKKNYKEEIKEAVNSLKQQWDKEKQIIEFTLFGRSILVPAKNIVYIESGQHKVIVNMIMDKISVNESMDSISKRLVPYGFIRVHKGYLVNYKFISLFSKEEVFLKNGERLSLSKYRKNQVLKEYQIFLLKEKL